MAKEKSASEKALTTVVVQIVASSGDLEGSFSITTALGTFKVQAKPGQEGGFAQGKSVEIEFEKPIDLSGANQPSIVKVTPLEKTGVTAPTTEGRTRVPPPAETDTQEPTKSTRKRTSKKKPPADAE